MGRVKRIWYLSPMRAAKVQASLRIRAVSPEPPLLAHTSSESRGTFRQKARFLACLNGWHAQLKFVMTECSETQIRLTGRFTIWKPLSLFNVLSENKIHFYIFCFALNTNRLSLHPFEIQSLMRMHGRGDGMELTSSQLPAIFLSRHRWQAVVAVKQYLHTKY